MKRSSGVLSVLLLLATMAVVHAAGFIIVSDPDASNEIIIQSRPTPPDRRLPFVPPPDRRFAFAPLEVTSLQARTRIKDQLANTVVEQEFYNPNPRPVEGTFVFPVPKGAHLEKFAMQIGGASVEAELLDADKARRLYEDIVRKVKDPALLEYAGRDLLKARIFPIEPHGHKRVTLSYAQLLKLDSGLVSFGFPLDAGKFSSQPVRNLSLKIELETRRPLKSVYSPTHNVEIRRHGANQATVGFESSNLKPDSAFELLFSSEPEELGFNFMAQRDGSEDGYFLLLASPGFDVKPGKVLAKDVAFVLDTSGSMAGPKLEQAKKALLFCIENLNDDDRFEIIRFATETEPLFGALQASSTENRSRARGFVKQLKPIGGTAIDEALRKALDLRPAHSDRPYVIVFLTDGRPTVGTTEEDKIVAHVSSREHAGGKGGTRIFCFGIGTDVNTHLLDRITEQTHAFSQYVLPEEDIEVKVSTFFSKIKAPLLADLKLTIGDNVRVTKMYPSALPDLFQGEQLAIVGRYSGEGEAAIVLEGHADQETRRFRYHVRFPESSSAHEFIPRLWATRRVGYLLDEIRLHGDNSELRQEVTALARQYGLITPYTAYLILEDETHRGVPLSLQSMPSLNRDLPAQQIARESYSRANEAKTGPSAVLAARYGLAMRQADNAQAVSAGAIEAQRTVTAAQPTVAGRTGIDAARPVNGPASAERLVQYTQQSQFVNGRNFFLNGNQWIDGTVQSQTNAPRVKIQFNSPEYFELVTKHPRVAPWLALGQNVQFALDGKVYEVTAGKM